MKHVVVLVSLLSAANLRVCESDGPAGSASASAQASASVDSGAAATAVGAAKASAAAALRAPRIGGSVVAAGDHSVELALHESGVVEALVLDASGKAVTDAKLGITATAKGGAKEKISLAFAAPRARFEGRAKAGVELASGPVDVALEIAGKPIEAKLDLGVALPRPKLGGHVLAVGDLGAEVVARANGDIDARLFDSAGAEIKGGVDCKARFGAGGDVELKFDPARACFHGQAKAGLTPGSLELSVGAAGKAKVGALASASLVASAAHGGQVVAVGDYSVELVAKGPEISAFVFDASGKALAAGDVDLALDLGANANSHLALVWDPPSLSYKAKVSGGLDLSLEPIRVSLNAAGKAFVGAVASLRGAAAATLDATAKLDADAKLGAGADVNAKLKAPTLDAKVGAGANAAAKAGAAATAKVTPPKVNVSVNKSASAGAKTGGGAGAKASAGFSFGTKLRKTRGSDPPQRRSSLMRRAPLAHWDLEIRQHMSALSDFLEQQLVCVTAGTPESTKALTKLIAKVDDDLVAKTDKRQPQWSEPDKFTGAQAPIYTDWSKIYGMGTAANDFRLLTFDLASFAALVPTQNDPRSDDGAGSPQSPQHERRHAPKGYMKDKIRPYLKAVLNGPLQPLKAKALEVANKVPGYQAVGTLDYYRDRSVDTHVFHKDTAGTTLFVALHYLNSIPLLGAEYIYDKKPLGHDEWGPIVSAAERGATKQKRPDQAWPPSLEKAMKTARSKLPLETRPKIHCKEIAPNEILTFVDELIFHASPFAGKRPEAGVELKKPFNYREYLSVSMSEQRFAMRDDVPIDKPSKAFVRTVSEDDLRTPAKGPDKKRRFARLWICIQPKNWTELA